MDRDAILRELGLGPIWKLRQAAQAATAAMPHGDPMPRESSPRPARSDPATTDDDVEGMDWDALATTVAACRKCRLCERRKQAVLGVGDRNADWLFVGEGPGADEDEKGEPFVGQAGKLLDAMLAAIDLKRGDNVSIANVLKSRPPGNRNPEPDEVAACRPYLLAQIDLIQPKLIVALGRFAAQSLLDTDEAIGRLRGRVHRFQNLPLVVTYHPAYLLRNLPDKARAWEDLCLARRTMQTLAPSR